MNLIVKIPGTRTKRDTIPILVTRQITGIPGQQAFSVSINTMCGHLLLNRIILADLVAFVAAATLFLQSTDIDFPDGKLFLAGPVFCELGQSGASNVFINISKMRSSTRNESGVAGHKCFARIARVHEVRRN